MQRQKVERNNVGSGCSVGAAVQRERMNAGNGEMIAGE
jgi:hypothetical protein